MVVWIDLGGWRCPRCLAFFHLPQQPLPPKASKFKRIFLKKKSSRRLIPWLHYLCFPFNRHTISFICHRPREHGLKMLPAPVYLSTLETAVHLLASCCFSRAAWTRVVQAVALDTARSYRRRTRPPYWAGATTHGQPSPTYRGLAYSLCASLGGGGGGVALERKKWEDLQYWRGPTLDTEKLLKMISGAEQADCGRHRWIQAER